MSKFSLSTLTAKLSEKSGLSTTEAELFIRKMFDVCHQGLEADKQVKMRWLGTFKVTSVKDRESVDVNTGERIVIEGRDKISFTPDNILKEIVNKPFAQFETVVVNDGVDFDDIDKKFEAEIEEEELAKEESAEAAGLEEEKSDETSVETPAENPAESSSENPAKDSEEKSTEKSDENSNKAPEDRPLEILAGGSNEDSNGNSNDGSNEDPTGVSTEVSVDNDKQEQAVNNQVTQEKIVYDGVIDFLATPDAQEPTSEVIVIGEDVTAVNTGEASVENDIHIEDDKIASSANEISEIEDAEVHADDAAKAEIKDEVNIEAKAEDNVETKAEVSVEAKDETKVEAKDEANNGVDGTEEHVEITDKAVESPTEDVISEEAEEMAEEMAEEKLRRSHFILPKWAVIVASIIVLALIGGMGWFAFNYGQMTAQRDHLAMQLDHYKSTKVAPKPLQKSQEEILREKAKEDSLRMLKASEALAAAEKAEKDSLAAAKALPTNTLSAQEQAELDKQSKGNKSQAEMVKDKLAKEKLAKDKLAKEKLAKQKLEQEKKQKEMLEKENNASKYDHDARVRTGAYRIVGVAQTVTVSEGQSLSAISKRYLGPGMECYIEALNGTSTVKSGQKIKIPKLELKKKK